MVSLSDLPKDQKEHLYSVIKEVILNLDRQTPTFLDFIKPTLEEFTSSIDNIKDRLKAQSKNLKANLQNYFRRYIRSLVDSVLMSLLPEYNTNIPSHIEVRKVVFRDAYDFLWNSTFTFRLQQIIQETYKKTEKQLWA